jgi:hypothetical protein
MPVRSNAVDRGPSTVGTLDIGLLRQAASEVLAVAHAVPPSPFGLGIGGRLVQIADELAGLVIQLEGLDDLDGA